MLVAAASSGAAWGGQLRARHVLTRSSHAVVGPYTDVRPILDSAVALHPFHPPRSLTWVPGEHGSPRAKPTPLRVRRRSAARGAAERLKALQSPVEPDADATRKLDARVGRATPCDRCATSIRCASRRSVPSTRVGAAMPSQPSQRLLLAAARALVTSDATPTARSRAHPAVCCSDGAWRQWRTARAAAVGSGGLWRSGDSCFQLREQLKPDRLQRVA